MSRVLDAPKGNRFLRNLATCSKVVDRIKGDRRKVGEGLEMVATKHLGRLEGLRAGRRRELALMKIDLDCLHFEQFSNLDAVLKLQLKVLSLRDESREANRLAHEMFEGTPVCLLVGAMLSDGLKRGSKVVEFHFADSKVVFGDDEMQLPRNLEGGIRGFSSLLRGFGVLNARPYLPAAGWGRVPDSLEVSILDDRIVFSMPTN